MSGRFVLKFSGSIWSFSSSPGKGEFSQLLLSSVIPEYQPITDVHHKDNTAETGLGEILRIIKIS